MPRHIDNLCLLNESVGEPLHLEQIWTIGMKKKKIHEVERLAQVISSVNKVPEIQTVLDIGAGKGYISHILKYYSKMNVIGIEGQATHSTSATTWGEKLRDRLIKRKNRDETFLLGEYSGIENVPEDNSRFFHYFVEPDMDVSDFKNMLNNVLDNDNEEVGMISLHACGNLSPSILRLFNTLDNVSTLVNIGCCYMKMVEENYQTQFPMSKVVNDLLG
eukprot:TRINITY_DN551_c0_g1_i2.p1 TRINITY_DN551_c0_g1~~TRINITY_DN551_c0_g1_i2.p1  ORF type:complete len:218 (+),score=49.45 TRINITY_DN551_c0_g1_i2:121-774(+)